MIISLLLFTAIQEVAMKTPAVMFKPIGTLGLDANFNLPVRYARFQAIEATTGEKFNQSVGAVRFSLKSDSRTGGPRYRPQVLDFHDGTYIIRWRVHMGTLEKTLLEVWLNESTKVFSHTYQNGFAAEDCDCPFDQESSKVWTRAIECPEASEFPQMQTDFATFPSIKIERLAKEVPERFNRSHSMMHYAIINNKLYRRQYGQHGGFKIFSDGIFLSLLRKVTISDTEFVMNLGDWPAEKRKVEDDPVPILTWGGSRDTRDISLPTWDMSKKTYSGLYQEATDVQTTAAANLTEWSSKIPKAFFRGRDSKRERLELVRLSKKYPDMIDAGLTNYFFFRKGEEQELGKAERVPMGVFHKFKYQINIDGTVAAYRLPILLAGNSVVFKHGSNFYEHFYSQLQPWVHYIPYKVDLSDLLDRIKWAKQNDEKAKQIATNGRKFVLENLTPNLIYCYYYRVLETYTSRQVGTPKLHERMEEIPQPAHKCDCSQIKNSRVSKDEL